MALPADRDFDRVSVDRPHDPPARRGRASVTVRARLPRPQNEQRGGEHQNSTSRVDRSSHRPKG